MQTFRQLLSKKSVTDMLRKEVKRNNIKTHLKPQTVEELWRQKCEQRIGAKNKKAVIIMVDIDQTIGIITLNFNQNAPMV